MLGDEDVSNILRGGSPRPITDYITSDKDGLNWLKIGDVDKESKYVINTEDRVITTALSKTREVFPGDLIMSNSMSFGRPYILKIQTCIHDGWIAVTEINKEIDTNFLYYVILSDSSQRYFTDSAAGGGIKNLNAEIIKKLPIAIPLKFEEQQKIASCLSSLDELIAAHTEKLDALQEHKKGLLQNVFPREGQTIPNFRFSEFEDDGEWVEKELSQIAEYTNGKAHEQDIDENGKYNVVNSKFISSEGETVKRSRKAFCLANKGDILMVLSDVPNGKAIAKCFFVNEDNKYTVNQRICKITAPSSDPLFVFYTMDRNPYFLAFDDGVKQTNLRKDDVLSFPFLIPKNPKEQQKIASCLSAVDELISAQSTKIDELKEHKKGLMQGLFPRIEN